MSQKGTDSKGFTAALGLSPRMLGRLAAREHYPATANPFRPHTRAGVEWAWGYRQEGVPPLDYNQFMLDRVSE